MEGVERWERAEVREVSHTSFTQAVGYGRTTNPYFLVTCWPTPLKLALGALKSWSRPFTLLLAVHYNFPEVWNLSMGAKPELEFSPSQQKARCQKRGHVETWDSSDMLCNCTDL